MSDNDNTQHNPDDDLPPGCWVCKGNISICNCPTHNEHLR